MSMLINLGREIPVRGAIEIGAALSWPRFGIYGPAYYGAYDLESSVAGYPRIVIGPDLLEYLHRWEESDGTDSLSRMNRELVKYFVQMMCVDVDGRWIVDFLSARLPALSGHDRDEKMSQFLQDQREKGLKFVAKELERFREEYKREDHRQERKSDLAFRYAHLLNYYTVRSVNQDGTGGMHDER